MVAKLHLPKHNSIELIENVVEERVHFADFFKLIKEHWVGQILHYQENSGDPSKVSPLQLAIYITEKRIREEALNEARPRESDDPLSRLIARRHNSLRGLYKPDRDKELYHTLEELRNKHKLNYCPCCGSPGKPTTLDHYLPQSVFPELSIVFENLTPMCSKCNELKDDKIYDEYGNRGFIHPYYDPIAEVRFQLIIGKPFCAPSSFELRVPHDVDEPFRSVILSHLKEIDFINRFEEFCIEEYTDLLSTLAEEKEDEDRESIDKIILNFYNKGKRRSENKWVAIFYRGILDNAELLDYFENEDLSSYLEEA